MNLNLPDLKAVKKLLRRARGVGGAWLAGDVRYATDGLATLHAPAFLDDPRFQRAYAAGRATGSWKGTDIAWRAHVACVCGARGAALDGDFVECGVDRGGLSEAVMSYVDWPSRGRQFWLLDTYEGLVDRCITDAERARGLHAGGYEPCWEDVQRRFGGRAGVTLVRGVVPDTLAKVTATKIAYLSIDMNCAGPELAAVEHFWDRLVPGAAVLLDDYGWNGHEEQRYAMDGFAKQAGVPILCLPTGQGLFYKP